MKDCKNFFKVFSFYLGLDLVLLGFILSLVLLGVVDHLLDVLLGKSALVVGDGDLLALSCGLVLGTHVQDTVGVDLEGHLTA